MPFDDNVREDALVACARHCCLCHRLKHTKMECHHIVQEADGGPNTFDNCIPLCLECHGEVRGYDPQHPVGTKYKPKELKRRRDDWYAKVKNENFVKLDARHEDIDRALLARLRETLSSRDAENLFRDLYYGGRVPRKVIDLLAKLAFFVDAVESQFLNPTLEGLFGEFRSSVKALFHGPDLYQMNSDDGDSFRLPKKYHSADPEEYDQYLEEYQRLLQNISEGALRVYESYSTLVRECRRLLAAD